MDLFLGSLFCVSVLCQYCTGLIYFQVRQYGASDFGPVAQDLFGCLQGERGGSSVISDEF
jgi:hypothetical protein